MSLPLPPPPPTFRPPLPTPIHNHLYPTFQPSITTPSSLPPPTWPYTFFPSTNQPTSLANQYQITHYPNRLPPYLHHTSHHRHYHKYCNPSLNPHLNTILNPKFEAHHSELTPNYFLWVSMGVDSTHIM
jgi:hypothetical protein